MTVTLAQLILTNNIDCLKCALSNYDVNKPHPEVNHYENGYSPLTLAIHLSRLECIQLLVAAGASILVKDNEQWSPLDESVSIGNRQVIKHVIRARKEEIRVWVDSIGTEIVRQVSQQIGDFTARLSWRLQSWIPLLSRICPSDTLTITKRGNRIRLDCSLVGFESLSWVRGNISLIHDGTKLVLCDHDRRLVQQIYPHIPIITEQDIEEEVSISLNSKITAVPRIDFEGITISRQQIGFWPFKIDRYEIIEGMNTSCWSIDNIVINWKHRLEHLNARGQEQSQESKQKYQITNPDTDGEIANEPVVTSIMKQLSRFAPSLPPPPNSVLVDDESFESSVTKKTNSRYGREHTIECSAQKGRATIWIQDAAQSNSVRSVIRILAPLLDHLGIAVPDLEALLERCPGGFLRQIEIPMGLIPLSGVITFSDYIDECQVDQSFLSIPDIRSGYREGDVLKPANS